MNYCIEFGVKVEGASDVYAIINKPDFAYPALSVGYILKKCMHWNFDISTWYPLTEVMPKIQDGIFELVSNREKYTDKANENAYQDVSLALKTLESIRDWVDLGRYYTCNSHIPCDCLYIIFG